MKTPQEIAKTVADAILGVSALSDMGGLEDVAQARELYRKQALLERVGIDPGIVHKIQKKAELVRSEYVLRCGNDHGYIEEDEQTGHWWFHHVDGRKWMHRYQNMSDENIVRRWLSKNLPKGVRVEFQPDPRGHSLYVYYGTGETEYVSFG
jgi:hypothetical protein